MSTKKAKLVVTILVLLFYMVRPAGVELASETEKIDVHIHQLGDFKLSKCLS